MKLKTLLLILIVGLSTLSVGLVVKAQSLPSTGTGGAGVTCVAPYYIPSTCTDPYVPGVSDGYTADLTCQLIRITKPGSTEANCCPNTCVSKDGSPMSATGATPAEFLNLEVFNTKIRVNPDNIGTLINILFTTVLGIVSLYVIGRGIYVAGVKRPMATTADDIAGLNKELTNLVIGAIICWGFIIVIQVIANFLGVGQLSNLDFSSESSGTVVTIK